MNEQAQPDHALMARAVELAARGLYSGTQPNPRVGCVLVRDGRIIGEGWHRRFGEGHAEVNALADVAEHGETASGAKAYVTLEPCSHQGKTPPCCEALIEAGVSRVVVAMQDPNPRVAGRGIDRLRAAGIEVDVGIGEAASRELNPGFIKRMETGLPWLRVKLAMSLDGRTAMASGESQWITGPAARSDVQRLRARSCAVLSGVGTILADDAALTVRAAELGLEPAEAAAAAANQPWRVVVDSSLRTPPDARLLQQDGPCALVTRSEGGLAYEALSAAGAELKVLASAGAEGVDLPALVRWLGERNCNEVLVEAGPTLAGALARAELVDHFTIFMAPTLLGSDAQPLLQLPLTQMSQQRRLQVDSITPVGDDWRIEAKPASSPLPG